MKNREKLNSMTNEELADLFCETMEKIIDKSDTVTQDLCDICPVKHLCKMGNNGFLVWLEKEAEG
jgi:hypothetical protein